MLKWWSDYSFRQNLSPIARKACRIVDNIRQTEQKQIWTPEVEESLARTTDTTIFPGMMFSLAKERIENTRLWTIVRRMPKGCLLHAHMDAMVDFGFLFSVLLATPGIHISSAVPLCTPSALTGAEPSFRYRKSASTDGDIWSDAYVPGTFILLTKAADEFPDGGREGFVRWLKSRCTISSTDSVEQHHGVDEIWRKFSKCFMVIGTVIHYEPVFRKFLWNLMETLYADGVSWIEVRCVSSDYCVILPLRGSVNVVSWLFKWEPQSQPPSSTLKYTKLTIKRFTWPLNYCREGEEEPEPDYNHMFQVIDEEVDRFKASPAGAGFWGLRTIWTSLRIMPTRRIVQDMDNCIMTKLAWPHLIAGYDLVGQEDLGRPLKSLLPELFWFRKQCAEEGVEIPFFFHAGETLGSGTETDNNLFDAILLGTRRIGHGFSAYKHPLLIQMLKDKRILIESCPISNEVLRLCSSIQSHPLPALLARGVACALCNDDPAMLGQDTAGMSHDFWQALQGWENLGLAGLGALAENSVRWAAFEDQTSAEWTRDLREASLGAGVKAKRLKDWGVEWERFCLWIVTEYGDEIGEEEDG
jgi:adenosine deaminase CECR1